MDIRFFFFIHMSMFLITDYYVFNQIPPPGGAKKTADEVRRRRVRLAGDQFAIDDVGGRMSRKEGDEAIREVGLELYETVR